MSLTAANLRKLEDQQGKQKDEEKLAKGKQEANSQALAVAAENPDDDDDDDKNGAPPVYVSASERQFLSHFYESLKGGSWTPGKREGWDKHADLSSDPNTWAGLTVSEGHVTKIRMFNANLEGELPDSIGNLSHLQELYLSSNKISGALPDSIIKCTRLTTLVLSDNMISDSLPNDIGRMTKLQHLDMHINSIGGTLPKSIGRCKGLKTLNFGINNLQGTLPLELDWKNLEYLCLAGNKLYGMLPGESISRLKSLQYFNVSSNRFTGKLPDSFGNLRKIEVITANDNDFRGPIPTEALCRCANLRQLRLMGNEQLLEHAEEATQALEAHFGSAVHLMLGDMPSSDESSSDDEDEEEIEESDGNDSDDD